MLSRTEKFQHLYRKTSTNVTSLGKRRLKGFSRNTLRNKQIVRIVKSFYVFPVIVYVIVFVAESFIYFL